MLLLSSCGYSSPLTQCLIMNGSANAPMILFAQQYGYKTPQAVKHSAPCTGISGSGKAKVKHGISEPVVERYKHFNCSDLPGCITAFVTYMMYSSDVTTVTDLRYYCGNDERLASILCCPCPLTGMQILWWQSLILFVRMSGRFNLQIQ